MEYDNEEYNWQPFIDVDAPLPNQVSPFATTIDSSIQTLFSMIDVSPSDVVLDFGSGDGRIVLYAAEKFKIHDLVLKSNRIAKEKGLSNLATFFVKSFLEEGFDWTFNSADLNWNSGGWENGVVAPTILTMYLVPEALELLYPRLEEYCGKMKQQQKKVKILSVVFKLEKWNEWLVATSAKNNIFLYIR